MKTLLLIRHAKSSWNDASVSDFDRPLNDRGKKNAPEMAKRLAARKLVIDDFLSSPALRAKKTAELFAKELDISKKHLHFVSELYEASPETFGDTIAGAPAKAGTIALFSHNPGITAYADSLTNTRIDNMPTCAIFAVQADVNDWKEFANAPKEFLFFDYPKKEE